MAQSVDHDRLTPMLERLTPMLERLTPVLDGQRSVLKRLSLGVAIDARELSS